MPKHTFVAGQILTAQQLNENFGEIPIVRSGSVTVNIPDRSSSVTGVRVNFATAFATTPNVVVGMSGAPGGSQKLIPRAYNVTATGFSIAVYTGDATSVDRVIALSVDWIAVGS